MTDTKTASEIHAQLGISEPFKDWIAKQPGFGQFESFYDTLPGGKLGKDYRLKPEQAALLLPSVPSLPKPVAAPGKKKKPPPEVIIEGQRSVYWYTNSMGQHLDKISLDLLGRAAGARCNELGIVMGTKIQKEIWPDGRKWQGMVRTRLINRFRFRGFGNNGTESPVKLSSYTITGQRTGYSESLAGLRRGRSSPFFTSSGIKKEYLPGMWI
jgi:hypothetical protein